MAISTKTTFKNASGLRLDGALESPDGMAGGYALYAHCFACARETAAAVKIAHALAESGVAVLRFDFAGLGRGGGSAITGATFSSAVYDLLAAARYMRDSLSSPRLLIGHGLGGAGALAAAGDMESVRAVAVISAPAEAAQVQRLFEQEAEKAAAPERSPAIAGRFMDDPDLYDMKAKLERLRRALLILHSPADSVLPAGGALSLFEAARHPKSFIALDGADHLLSGEQDAAYAARLVAAWGLRYCAAA